MEQVQENAMQDDVVLEEDGEFTPPTVGHVEIVFQALDDTIKNVAGTEGLTGAQVYMEGILRSRGVITYQDSVQGTEGLFSKIGGGAKKILDYIINLFKRLWGFFFKKDAPEQAKKIKDEIKEKKEALSNVEEVKKGLARALAAGDHNSNSSSSTDVATLKEKISSATSLSELNTVAKTVAKDNTRAQKAAIQRIANLVESLKEGVSVVDEIDKASKAAKYPAFVAFASKANALGTASGNLITLLSKVREIEDLDSTKHLLGEMESGVGHVEKTIQEVSSTESTIKSQIDILEKAINSSGDNKQEHDKENLDALNAMMKAASKLSTALQRGLEHLKSANSAIAKVFGL